MKDRSMDIRFECLSQLSRWCPLALSEGVIRSNSIRDNQASFTEKEIVRELHFLIGQGLCEASQSPATGQIRYRITSKGILEFSSLFKESRRQEEDDMGLL